MPSVPERRFPVWLWFLLGGVVGMPLLCCGGGIVLLGLSNVFTTERATTASLKVEEEIRVRAADLLAQYQANEVAADQRYKGRTIVVTGLIDHVGKDLFDNPHVTLKANESLFRVQCLFRRRDENELARLHPNQPAAIRGTCTGKMANVLLRDCEVVLTGN